MYWIYVICVENELSINYLPFHCLSFRLAWLEVPLLNLV